MFKFIYLLVCLSVCPSICLPCRACVCVRLCVCVCVIVRAILIFKCQPLHSQILIYETEKIGRFPHRYLYLWVVLPLSALLLSSVFEILDIINFCSYQRYVRGFVVESLLCLQVLPVTIWLIQFLLRDRLFALQSLCLSVRVSIHFNDFLTVWLSDWVPDHRTYRPTDRPTVWIMKLIVILRTID